MRIIEEHFFKYLRKHEMDLPITEKRRLIYSRMAIEASEAHRQTIFVGGYEDYQYMPVADEGEII